MWQGLQACAGRQLRARAHVALGRGIAQRQLYTGSRIEAPLTLGLIQQFLLAHSASWYRELAAEKTISS